MKNIKIEVKIPDVCPQCGNPNTNIEGSVYDSNIGFKFSCMGCGKIYHKKKLDEVEMK